ncbi:MAG: hypothetical protein K9W46_11600 [Candidatus Heimdallarchaeum endolithica]|uniref:Uncharacterized protein n=1 Tax=Candidatus Heimdallarchaeum endolithica TaxID=2876572 RepID=A0A9Y1BQD2_9ARCH|nr:MAG: hypothetical protein K9W46_11600 [Candidatus Heimdallarchaeum endolithica]
MTMHNYTDTVLERQTLLGKFLDNLNYRPIRKLYKKMGSLFEYIDIFLSSDEGSLFSLRSSLLSLMASLARTYYQSSLIDNLRVNESVSREFDEEVSRARTKGLIEKEAIVEKIINVLEKAKDLFLIKEKLNNKWQEIYYLLSSETEESASFRQQISLVNEKNREYIQKFFTEPDEIVQLQKEQVEEITDLSFQAAELGDKAQMILRELLDMSINPLSTVFEDEINTAEKILSQINTNNKAKDEERIPDEQLGRLCDVLSWGLDDVSSVEELIKLGKELRNELASIMSEFLVFLVDIDLEIQELENIILSSAEI